MINSQLSDNERNKIDQLRKHFMFMIVALIGFLGGLYLIINHPQLIENDVAEVTSIEEEIKDGIHVNTGLITQDGYQVVASQCGACHSLDLVTQNRATREGWKDIIRWMQKTQKLWDLGENEPIILNYLSTHYAPEQQGRRAPLANIEWYEL